MHMQGRFGVSGWEQSYTPSQVANTVCWAYSQIMQLLRCIDQVSATLLEVFVISRDREFRWSIHVEGREGEVPCSQVVTDLLGLGRDDRRQLLQSVLGHFEQILKG